MPIQASMTLKCKIAVTTDTSFRGKEVQPGVDPDQCCTADSNKKVQTPFIHTMERAGSMNFLLFPECRKNFRYYFDMIHNNKKPSGQ